MLHQITRATGDPHSEVIMRYLISALLLTVLIVGWQQPAVGQIVQGSVVTGQDFVLGWPTIRRPAACIEIPGTAIGPNPGQIPNNTVIQIRRLSHSDESEDWPEEARAFKNHHRPEPGPNRRMVFPPIFEFSANQSFTISDPSNHLTIGICAQYHPSDTAAIRRAKIARAVSANALDFWDRVPPPNCLRCRNNPAPMPPGDEATGYLRQLFAGSPFTATPLYALPEPEGGLGGDGGSLSPFAAAEE
jgi:hypothetical protein